MKYATPIAAIAVAVALGLYGWFLLFKTSMIVNTARHTHRHSPAWIQNWPFHRMIFKPWYPAYLRCGGVFAWLVALCLLLIARIHLMR